MAPIAIRAHAGDRSEIAHLQDRAEMLDKGRSMPTPSATPVLLRPQDLQVPSSAGFIDDIVRELTEGD